MAAMFLVNKAIYLSIYLDFEKKKMVLKKKKTTTKKFVENNKYISK